jgi:hypothetical protein
MRRSLGHVGEVVCCIFVEREKGVNCGSTNVRAIQYLWEMLAQATSAPDVEKDWVPLLYKKRTRNTRVDSEPGKV